MQRDTVVIGASAGGVEALKKLVSALPGDLPAAVLVVLHLPAHGNSVLPAILGRAGPLPARHARSGDRLRHGEILVAPPDLHMMIEDGRVLLTRGPQENGHRPAVDVLFRSAAYARGPATIGVVLSGVLDDGTAGLYSIHRRSGLAMVQDPDEAQYPSMPRSAAEQVPVDHVASAEKLASLIDLACRASLMGDADAPSALLEAENQLAKMDETAMNDHERPGSPSGYSCPDCGGPLFEIHEGELQRYRCRVGHAWSGDGLLVQQAMQFDGALWMALRSLEEKSALANELADRAARRGGTFSERTFREKAEQARDAATHIRALLESTSTDPVP